MQGTARIIKREELEQLLELYGELHPEDPDPAGNPSLKGLWDQIASDPCLFYLVAEEDGRLVSSCTLAIVKNLTRNLRPYGIIENVITAQQYRNKGYATLVLQKAIAIAKDHNCYKVMLLSGSKSEDTLRFYENSGFKRGMKTGFIINLA